MSDLLAAGSTIEVKDSSRPEKETVIQLIATFDVDVNVL